MEQGQAGEFMRLVEAWRDALGLSPREFSAYLGRSEVELSLLRAGKRRPSPAFAGVVLSRAPEPWRTALERAHADDLRARTRLAKSA